MASPFVAIVGPTGSGKSALALFLARHFRAEIVNCDSVQVYRHFNIGTAKITAAEMQGVPHHLIDMLEPEEVFTAGDFARVARQCLREIAARGNLPVVVGGTGFYLRAMIDGLFAGPQRDDALRKRLALREEKRAGSMHRILRRLDAQAAARIHPHDRNKVMRALEVRLLAKRPMTELHAEGSEPLTDFAPVLLGLDPPRAELFELLNRRCEQMIEKGLVLEVENILAQGIAVTAKPFESLGYKQILRFVQGVCTQEQAVDEMRVETRRYAKRQWTWFKRDTRVSWISGFGHMLHVQQQAVETIVKTNPHKAFFRTT
ncbi:MAG: tRNA (adenosine(37)-N6)-dimethylallyltransferase MiaA [Candidatus Solibacter usitatus]|nr:tRNA (adenosine(37)-N6)-dimethylallyltransferase MiaA [Candidatus Solibacter usitatus]